MSNPEKAAKVAEYSLEQVTRGLSLSSLSDNLDSSVIGQLLPVHCIVNT